MKDAAERLSFRKYTLEVRGGQGPQSRRTFDQRVVYLGSSPDNRFVVDDPAVSRQHCRIEVDRQGHRIVDLDSKNGTFVDGLRVRDAYLPAGGATLELGTTQVLFRPAPEQVEVLFSSENRFGRLLGESLEMREIFGMLARVAPTDATVLVEGESGTGKELAADAIHQHSRRKDGPFVVFDCSAVPADLMESELFGHVKGAFTGATATRTGAFAEAQGGTLFLDEVGELALELQPKLLRCLEKREIKPVGSNQRVVVDVRIVAATNQDLERKVEAGEFREDLFYRLAVIRVNIPPLRNRIDDIPLLVRHFLEEVGRAGAGPVQISYDTMRKLQAHRWPGNVRELRNFIERAALLTDSGHIETRFMADQSPRARRAADEVEAPPGSEGPVLRVDYDLPYKDAKNLLVEAFERQYWIRQLAESGGNISEAARRSGIHRKSLEYLVKKLDLRAK